MMDTRYSEFLASKAPRPPRVGFEPDAIPSHLFDFQAQCAEDCIRMGRAGLYLDTGLGKTRIALEWAWQCLLNHTGSSKALIFTPLAVAKQMAREGQALGYDCRVIRDQSEAKAGINICNYDRLDKIDGDEFGPVALDESGILKSFSGKTSQGLIGMFDQHRFKLAASATPAPNDHMELGQQSAFLGMMPASEMLMRWFINDTREASQQWRLKGHAVEDFFDWMASWSRMAESPEDLGFDGSRYVLPPLNVHRHKVEDGSFEFGQVERVSAANMFAIKNRTAAARADLIAPLAPADRPFAVWCDTDAESRALKDRMPDAIEVKGSMPIDAKEEALEAFALGQVKQIITKSSIAGWGSNWQHCADTAFVGRSFSYEAWYQAIRRFLRFGQTREVNCHLAVAEGEQHIGAVIDRKEGDHKMMKAAMKAAMARAVHRPDATLKDYNPTHHGKAPSWLMTSL